MKKKKRMCLSFASSSAVFEVVYRQQVHVLRERERERERKETDRQRVRETEREKERLIGRGDRDRDRQTDRLRQTDRPRDRQQVPIVSVQGVPAKLNLYSCCCKAKPLAAAASEHLLYAAPALRMRLRMP